MKYKQHKELIAGLRETADWLENNPRTIALPELTFSSSNYIYEYAKNEHGNTDWSTIDEFTTRLKMRGIAKLLGSSVKDYSAGLFSLRKVFGPITITFNANRAAICRKIVKETKIVPARTETYPERTEEVVEWVCDDPLLAG